jgi:hypothetical protein
MWKWLSARLSTTANSGVDGSSGDLVSTQRGPCFTLSAMVVSGVGQDIVAIPEWISIAELQCT